MPFIKYPTKLRSKGKQSYKVVDLFSEEKTYTYQREFVRITMALKLLQNSLSRKISPREGWVQCELFDQIRTSLR
jgi:hypothetical protein